MARIFISYRRTDSEGYAGRIWDRLTSKFGPGNVFMDVDSIEAGVSFPLVLSQALAECGAFVAVVGSNWLGLRADGTSRVNEPKDFVRQEILAAIAGNVRILPVLVGGAQMPAPEALPEELSAFASVNAVEIRHARFDADVAAVIQILETHLQELEAAKLRTPSEPADRLRPPELETKRFLRQRLGEPRGMGAVLFGPWEAS